MAGAATVVAGTSGIRLWLTARAWAWLTPSRLRQATRGLLVTAVVASGLLVSSSSSAPTPPTGGTLQEQTQAPNPAGGPTSSGPPQGTRRRPTRPGARVGVTRGKVGPHATRASTDLPISDAARTPIGLSQSSGSWRWR